MEYCDGGDLRQVRMYVCVGGRDGGRGGGGCETSLRLVVHIHSGVRTSHHTST